MDVLVNHLDRKGRASLPNHSRVVAIVPVPVSKPVFMTYRNGSIQRKGKTYFKYSRFMLLSGKWSGPLLVYSGRGGVVRHCENIPRFNPCSFGDSDLARVGGYRYYDLSSI